MTAINHSLVGHSIQLMVLLCVAIHSTSHFAHGQESTQSVTAEGADVILVVDGSLSMPIGETYDKVSKAIKERPVNGPPSFPADDDLKEFVKFRETFLADHRLPADYSKQVGEFAKYLHEKLNWNEVNITRMAQQEVTERVVLEKYRDQEFGKVVKQIEGFVSNGLPQVPTCSLTVIGFRNSAEIETYGTVDYADADAFDKRDALLDRLGKLQAKHGGSAIAPALEKGYKTAAALRAKNPKRRQYILLITDGDDHPANPKVVGGVIEAELLTARIDSLSAMFQSPDLRIREHFSLWYAHFGAENTKLKEAIVKLKGETKSIHEFRLSGVMIRTAGQEFSGLIPEGAADKTVQLQVDGHNLPKDAQLVVGDVAFPREWKLVDPPALVMAEFLSLTDGNVTFRFSDGRFTSEQRSIPLARIAPEDQTWVHYFEKIRQQLKTGNVKLNNGQNEIPIALPIAQLPAENFTIRLPLSTSGGLIITNRTFVDVRYVLTKPTIELRKATALAEGLNHERPGLASLLFDVTPKGFTKGSLSLQLKEALPSGITLRVGNAAIPPDGKSSLEVPLSQAVAKDGLSLRAEIAEGVADLEQEVPVIIQYMGDLALNFKVETKLRIVVRSKAPPIVRVPDNLRLIVASAEQPGTGELTAVLDETCLKAAAGDPIKLACRLKTSLPPGVTLWFATTDKELKPLSHKDTTFIELPAYDPKVKLVQIPWRYELRVDKSVTTAQPETSIAIRLVSTTAGIAFDKPAKEIAVAYRVEIGAPPVVSVLPAGAIQFQTLTPGRTESYRLTLVRNAEAAKLSGALLNLTLKADDDDGSITWSAGTAAGVKWPGGYDAAAKVWRWTEKELVANQDVVLVAEFKGTKPPRPWKGTVSITSNDKQLQISPATIDWRLQTATNVDVSLSPQELSWKPATGDGPVAPLLFQLKLADDAQVGANGLRLVLRNALQLAPREAHVNAPKLQLFLDAELHQPIDDQTNLQVVPQTKSLNVWWQLSSKQPETGTWNYTLHFQSADPEVQLKRDQFELKLTIDAIDWEVTPPSPITSATRAWPFEYFIRYQPGNPSDPKLYRSEYQLGDDGPVIQGRVREAERHGVKGLLVSAAEALPPLPPTFQLSKVDQPKQIDAKFRVLLNADSTEKEVDARKRGAWIAPPSFEQPALKVAYTKSGASRPLAPQDKAGVQLFAVPGGSPATVDIGFTSDVSLPEGLGGIVPKVAARRVYLVTDTTGTLDNQLLRRLRDASQNGKPPADIQIVPAANEDGEFALPSPTPNDKFQCQIAAPAWFYITSPRREQLRIVEQIVLQDGMEEWQETRLELQIPRVIPWLFIATILVVTVVLSATSAGIIWCNAARSKQRQFASIMKHWLPAQEAALQCDTGETFAHAPQGSEHIGQFVRERPKFRVVSDGWCSSRYAEWATFHEATDGGNPGPAHHLGLALSPQGLEICSSLPGNCTSTTDGRVKVLKPGVWLVIDEYRTGVNYEGLEIELHLPQPIEQPPTPAPEDDDGPGLQLDDEGPGLQFDDGGVRTAQFSLKWQSPPPPLDAKRIAKGVIEPAQEGRASPARDQDDYELDTDEEAGLNLTSEYSQDPEDTFELQEESSDSSTRLS